MKKLAIITTHPIQYNAPWFRLLTERKKIEIKVFYTWDKTKGGEKYDPGFSKNIGWDIPLLEGYDFTFVKNTSQKPGSKNYSGIKNPTLISEIESWKPDAVLVFGWNFQSHLKCLRHFHNKIPVLFRGDSTLLDEQKGFKMIARRILLTWVYRHTDFVLYVGTQNQNYFLKHGVKKDQLVFAPHAVDNERFFKTAAKEEDKKAGIRSSLKIKEDDLIFLYAGKLVPKKNVGILIKAFKLLGNDNIHLIIVGNGVLENELKQSASKTINIHFFPFQNQSELPAFYEFCDVFILPSKGPGESWGLVVNEAMACGKPVMVSNKCGCAVDLVEEEKTGYVFRSGDAEDLRRKIDRMNSQKDELKEMGRNAFQKIQDWSFDHIAEAIEELVINKC